MSGPTADGLPPLALSTMYAQRWPPAEGLEPFLASAGRLGFRSIELSHILSAEQVASLTGGMAPRVTTVHHPCPRPAGWRDDDALTSPLPEARGRAAEALAETLRSAQRLGATCVVLHLGMMPDDAAETGRRLRFELEARQRAGQGAGPAYRQALGAFLAWRSRREPAVLAQAWLDLQPLVAEAARLEIRLGLETGYSPLELPSPTGMAWLLGRAAQSTLPTGSLGAWLDTGHVAAQVALGVATWEDWWSAVGSRWIGLHLHDHVGLRDHLLPGMGQLDLAALPERLGGLSAATLEVDWYFSEAEIAACLGRLRAIGWRT